MVFLLAKDNRLPSECIPWEFFFRGCSSRPLISTGHKRFNGSRGKPTRRQADVSLRICAERPKEFRGTSRLLFTLLILEYAVRCALLLLLHTLPVGRYFYDHGHLIMKRSLSQNRGGRTVHTKSNKWLWGPKMRALLAWLPRFSLYFVLRGKKVNWLLRWLEILFCVGTCFLFLEEPYLRYSVSVHSGILSWQEGTMPRYGTVC